MFGKEAQILITLSCALAVYSNTGMQFDFSSNFGPSSSEEEPDTQDNQTTNYSDSHFDYSWSNSDNQSTNSGQSFDFSYNNSDNWGSNSSFGENSFPGNSPNTSSEEAADESYSSVRVGASVECKNIGFLRLCDSPKNQNKMLNDAFGVSYRKCSGGGICYEHGICSNSTAGRPCDCEVGWNANNDKHCKYPCRRKCVHGTCMLKFDPFKGFPVENVTDEHTACNCEHDFEHEYCQNKKKDPQEEARKLVILLVTSSMLLILLSVLVPILMWRHRVIVVMKIVYLFKQFEDDDGKQHDGYISMPLTEEAITFVQTRLIPVLEGYGFNLYIEARDQKEADVLIESKLKAIKNSRRTLLVITPEYIKDEWSRFEWLIAQHETLKMKQKIIPIILEDVSQERSTMDKSLKHIIDSIKCLHYPKRKDTKSDENAKKCFERKEGKFFKRLHLTMPKKKESNSSSDSSGVVFTSFTNLGYEHV